MSLFSRVLTFIAQEKEYFRRLSSDERKLLFSFLLFNLGVPLVTVFSVTFLWRATGLPQYPIVYIFCLFTALALGFFFNTFLLRRFRAHHLYMLGCVLMGLVPFLLTSSGPPSFASTAGAGGIVGLCAGLYWSNRHFLIAYILEKEHRFFFISVNTALAMATGIVGPLIIGWLLVLGEYLGIYSAESAYQVITFFGFGFFFFSGFLMAGLEKNAKVRPSSILPVRPTQTWRKFIGLETTSGLMDGIEAVVPILLILMLIGMEGSVGTIQSVAALISAGVLYLVGRKKEGEFTLLTWWSLASALGGLTLYLFFDATGLLIYFLCIGLVRAFRWACIESIMFRLIDKHVGSEEEKFAYILNRELFLDFSRAFSLLLLFIVIEWLPAQALHLAIFYIVILQIPFLLLLRNIRRHMPSLDSETVSR